MTPVEDELIADELWLEPDPDPDAAPSPLALELSSVGSYSKFG